MNDPLNMIQVLCTRLCHDLAGPIGAVAAGVELVGGDPSQVDAETLQLIANSSSAASRKLKFLRLALGTAGAGSAQDLQATVAGYFEAVAGPSGAAKIAWPAAKDLDALSRAAKGRGAQILVNLILLSAEVIPRLRDVAVTANQSQSSFVLSVTALGEVSPSLDPRRDLAALLAAPASAALSPKTVQALYAVDLAAQSGGKLGGEAIDGGWRATATLSLAE